MPRDSPFVSPCPLIQHELVQGFLQAPVAVRYRGNWLYITDDVESSLSTLTLLNQLVSLQIAFVKRSAPVLTTPVDG